MAFFFLLLVLETKFHYLEGEFASKSAFTLPIIAALGGAIIPVFIYYLFTSNIPEYSRGWAVPIATDTAFVLGVLSFFAHKVPLSARLFVVALSIIDDLIAVLVLALFYTSSLHFTPLLICVICVLLLAIINSLNVSRLSPYLITGGILWIALIEAGIHGTIAGVLLGVFIPVRIKREEDKTYSPLKRLERFLLPFVTVMILPLFAFLNSEIPFKELTLNDISSPITSGVLTGLFIGKPLGIIVFSFIAVRLGACNLPTSISWRAYYGISMLCGIGFTFSLFIGLLSFEEGYQVNQMKLGVILGSLLSVIGGILLLRILPNLPHNQDC